MRPQVKRGLRSRKIKCAIIAPNIDEGSSAGGLDDNVQVRWAALSGSGTSSQGYTEEEDGGGVNQAVALSRQSSCHQVCTQGGQRPHSRVVSRRSGYLYETNV